MWVEIEPLTCVLINCNICDTMNDLYIFFPERKNMAWLKPFLSKHQKDLKKAINDYLNRTTHLPEVNILKSCAIKDMTTRDIIDQVFRECAKLDHSKKRTREDFVSQLVNWLQTVETVMALDTWLKDGANPRTISPSAICSLEKMIEFLRDDKKINITLADCYLEHLRNLYSNHGDLYSLQNASANTVVESTKDFKDLIMVLQDNMPPFLTEFTLKRGTWSIRIKY